MRIRPTSPLFMDDELDAAVTTRPGAMGQAVLMVNGQPVTVIQAALAGYRLVDATEQECLALQRAGYPLTSWECMRPHPESLRSVEPHRPVSHFPARFAVA